VNGHRRSCRERSGHRRAKDESSIKAAKTFQPCRLLLPMAYLAASEADGKAYPGSHQTRQLWRQQGVKSWRGIASRRKHLAATIMAK